ncbi:MAG: archemetzincin [Thermoprotei archaeon]|nr:MAG: archemetzincin [Thermoprotei archaeon]
MLVLLQPIGLIEKTVLDYLSENLSKVYLNIDFLVAEPVSLNERFFDKSRGQYFSPLILAFLRRYADELVPHNYDKILGIMNADAYSNGLNFVFGEAELGGRVAIVYLKRLSTAFYGLSENYQLFLLRCLKEAVHELGHTLGLRHCAVRRCVMHFSNSIIDTDFKDYRFCGRCSRILGSRGITVAAF